MNISEIPNKQFDELVIGNHVSVTGGWHRQISHAQAGWFYVGAMRIPRRQLRNCLAQDFGIWPNVRESIKKRLQLVEKFEETFA